MTDALAVAMDDLFRDSNMARDAFYVPAGGEAVSVRIVSRRPDEIVDFGDTRIHTETTVFDVRTSEVAEPRPGDSLILDGTDYVIQGEPLRDAGHLVWTLDVRLA